MCNMFPERGIFNSFNLFIRIYPNKNTYGIIVSTQQNKMIVVDKEFNKISDEFIYV